MYEDGNESIMLNNLQSVFAQIVTMTQFSFYSI
jgi:hypothetical protein